MVLILMLKNKYETKTMKPLGRLKNIKCCGDWKRSFFKIGNWWEEMTEPITNKSARRKLKQQLKNEGW